MAEGRSKSFKICELTGSKVRLRIPDPKDARIAYGLVNDDRITRNILWDGPPSIEDLADGGALSRDSRLPCYVSSEHSRKPNFYLHSKNFRGSYLMTTRVASTLSNSSDSPRFQLPVAFMAWVIRALPTRKLLLQSV